MAHEDIMIDLDKRRENARAMGGEKKLKRRKLSGSLNAEERLLCLVDKDSFIEVGLLGAASGSNLDPATTPRDGKITGFGRIEGRDVGVCINDFTVKGASTGGTNSKKLGHIRRSTVDKGIPFIHIGESSGARLPDAMGSKGMGAMLGNDTAQFRRARENLWVAAALDTSYGSSAWLVCCSDFSVMRKGSVMSVSSPGLVSMAVGERVEPEDLGGWRIHADMTGLVDRFVNTDEEAMDEIRRFISYMPSNNMELPPEYDIPAGSGAQQEDILKILPASRTHVYDMHKILEVIVDKDSLLEIKPRFGKPAIAALARLGGKTIGIIANNPMVAGGAMSVEAIRKLINMTVLCDSFNIPIVRFMDTPGFVVGTGAEKKGAPGHIMNLMNATSLTTVPQITILVRKGYGRAYVALGGGEYNDEMVAWPTAEVSFMDPVFATKIVHGLSAGDDGFDQALAEIQKDIEIWDMASTFSAHDVIKPQETREYLIRMLDVHRRRRTSGIGQHLMKTWPTSS